MDITLADSDLDNYCEATGMRTVYIVIGCDTDPKSRL